MWRCNSFAFSYKKIKVMRCKTCPLYGCGSSKTAPINRAYLCVVSCLSGRAAGRAQHVMACNACSRRTLCICALSLSLCASGHVSPSVSIYLFITLALYYTKASLSLTPPHHAVFSTTYPQAYLSTNTFPQVMHRLIHKIIL